ncbi:uncharacterized protein [Linepithema humile]|uniref:uncharacterized protein isoform X2 n=1 Tax=Linepithema humile TaxID=83485 RepID=UPI00351EC294
MIKVRNKKGCQDICVETEAIEPSGNLPSSTEQENVLALVRGDSEKSAKFPQVEDIHRETVWKMVRNKKLPGQMERNCRSVDRKQNGDRDDEAKEKEKCSSWWKDGGQTVLQFFAKILGKRGGMGTKGPTDHVLPIDKRSRKRVERVSRDGQGHNRQRRGADGGSIRLKRVNNGYIADYTCRNEGNWRDTATENKSREEQQRPSILVRQIQQTRDKSLRVMLLERELRRRLPKTTKRDTHLIANGVVNIRRLSNPLC